MCGGGLRRPPGFSQPAALLLLGGAGEIQIVPQVPARRSPHHHREFARAAFPGYCRPDPGSPATETCRAVVGSPGSGRFFQGCEGESVPGVSQLAVSGGRWRPSACRRLTLVSASASHDLVPVCGLCPFPRGHRSRWIRAHLTPA